VQADSGFDSDSESQNKNEEIIPVNLLTQTVWIAMPTKDMRRLAPTLGNGVGT